jgi:hypothetical protein
MPNGVEKRRLTSFSASHLIGVAFVDGQQPGTPHHSSTTRKKTAARFSPIRTFICCTKQCQSSDELAKSARSYLVLEIYRKAAVHHDFAQALSRRRIPGQETPAPAPKRSRASLDLLHRLG